MECAICLEWGKRAVPPCACSRELVCLGCEESIRELHDGVYVCPFCRKVTARRGWCARSFRFWRAPI